MLFHPCSTLVPPLFHPLLSANIEIYQKNMSCLSEKITGKNGRLLSVVLDVVIGGAVLVVVVGAAAGCIQILPPFVGQINARVSA